MKLLLAAIISLSLVSLYAQIPGEWTWMKGDSTINHFGIFGVQGVADPLNNPPSLEDACGWTDSEGNPWLYGGMHYTQNLTIQFFGTLWKYDVSTDTWIWEKGSNVHDWPSSYGVKGVANSSNDPGSRFGAAYWTDTDGNFWLFGGRGTYGYQNDLWMYNVNTEMWSWISGRNTAGFLDTGRYGIQGVGDTANIPSPRADMAYWIDQQGNLWLFGGAYEYSTGGLYFFNDLWKYNISTREWTWLKGSGFWQTIFNPEHHFGEKNVPDANNCPPERRFPSCWTDLDGTMYMFGGYTLDNECRNDFWKYSTVDNEWTWLNGDTITNASGYSSDYCIYNTTNYPSSRAFASGNFISNDSSFWMFGGVVHDLQGNVLLSNEIWSYNPSIDKWMKIIGDSSAVFLDTLFSYGEQGISSPTSLPPAKSFSVTWKTPDGNFWNYGGEYYEGEYSKNDLWRYVPDTSCGITVNVQEVENNSTLFSVYPNPTTTFLYLTLPSLPSSVTILNSLGQQVLQTEARQEATIDVSQLPAGIYLLRVTTTTGGQTAKFVKE